MCFSHKRCKDACSPEKTSEARVPHGSARGELIPGSPSLVPKWPSSVFSISKSLCQRQQNQTNRLSQADPRYKNFAAFQQFFLPLQAPSVFPCQGSYLLSGLNHISSAIGSVPIASNSDHHTIDDQCCHMHRKVFIYCAATISATPTYFVHAHSSAWLSGPSKRRWCSLYWKCFESWQALLQPHA